MFCSLFPQFILRSNARRPSVNVLLHVDSVLRGERSILQQQIERERHDCDAQPERHEVDFDEVHVPCSTKHCLTASEVKHVTCYSEDNQ